MSGDDFFEKLRKIQLSERRHATLSQIDDDFYSELKKRLAESSSGEAAYGEDREYKNICAIGKDIIIRRKQKIVAKAQRDLSSDQISSEGLASEEREFYLSFVGLLKRMDSVLEPSEAGAKKKAAPCAPIPAGLDDRAFLSVKVRMLADVPEFLSSSMDSLGPFSSSQVVALPKEDADLLVNRNLALALEEAR
jgi:DNA replication initiation complex subunit (GINS family)